MEPEEGWYKLIILKKFNFVKVSDKVEYISFTSRGVTNMRKFTTAIITFFLILAVNYGVAAMFDIRFIEPMFFIGLAFVGLLVSFGSSGGPWSRSTDSQVSAQTGIIQETQQFSYRVNWPFWIALGYTIIGLIILILLIAKVIPPAS